MSEGYRLMIVLDVLDGSAPSEVARWMDRHYGPVLASSVVAAEVLDDEHEGPDARRAQESPEPGPPGRWLDA